MLCEQPTARHGEPLSSLPRPLGACVRACEQVGGNLRIQEVSLRYNFIDGSIGK